MKPLIITACLLICNSALGDDKYPEIKLTDGTVLKDVVIKSVEERGIRCEHSGGAGLVKKELLPADILERYGVSMAIEGGDRAEKEATARRLHEARQAKTPPSAPRNAPAEDPAATKVGPLTLTFVSVQAGMYRSLKTQRMIEGALYVVEATNSSNVRVSGKAGIAVALAGTPDDAGWFNFNLAPGESARWQVGSLFTPALSGKTVAVTLEAPGGKTVTGQLAVPDRK